MPESASNKESTSAEAATAELALRLERLEQENARLRAEVEGPKSGSSLRGGRINTVLATFLIVLGLLLAPIAAVGTWARVQLVNTDAFVATFAPLAKDPAIQNQIVDEVVSAIEAKVNIADSVDQAIVGIQSLNIPPASKDAIALLKEPAVQGIQSLLRTIVTKLVQSPEFAQIWETTLRQTHEQALAVINGDPKAMAQLSDNGTLSIQLGPIIDAAKQKLESQGVGFASAIPTINPSITLMKSNSLVLVRAMYSVAVMAGYWLPWAVLAVLAFGVLVARRRTVALMWAGIGFALAFATLALGFGAGKLYFMASVSPGIMTPAAAEALFGYVTAALLSTSIALLVLGVMVAVGAWFAGPSTSARRLRELFDKATSWLRSFGDEHGISTGPVGETVDRLRIALHALIIAIAVFVVMQSRPITMGALIAIVVVMLLAMLVVEIVRRPHEPSKLEAT